MNHIRSKSDGAIELNNLIHLLIEWLLVQFLLRRMGFLTILMNNAVLRLGVICLLPMDTRRFIISHLPPFSLILIAT